MLATDLSMELISVSELLKIEDLEVSYGCSRGLMSTDLLLQEGESLAVVGESGSGKTTLLRTIARLLPRQAVVCSGRVEFYGNDVLKLSSKEMRSIRGSSIAYVFQNGQNSLDPLFKIDYQFDEVLRAHDKDRSVACKEELLARMGIEDPSRILKALPCELSGGQCQRVAIALAVACEPKLLLADEPTGALDGEAQEKVRDLLISLNREFGVSLIVVTHDIDFASQVASRIAVMKDGRIIEIGQTERVMKEPSQSYTKKLIESIPSMKHRFKRVD